MRSTDFDFDFSGKPVRKGQMVSFCPFSIVAQKQTLGSNVALAGRQLFARPAPAMRVPPTDLPERQHLRSSDNLQR